MQIIPITLYLHFADGEVTLQVVLAIRFHKSPFSIRVASNLWSSFAHENQINKFISLAAPTRPTSASSTCTPQLTHTCHNLRADDTSRMDTLDNLVPGATHTCKSSLNMRASTLPLDPYAPHRKLCQDTNWVAHTLAGVGTASFTHLLQ